MTTDAINRRLRSAPPHPTVKRLVLTDADLLIFEAINRHGPLPTHYLYEFTKHLRKDYTHLQNRLTEFYNGDDAGPFLLRPPQQFAGYEARYQHIVYDLAPRAKDNLANRGTISSFRPRRSDPFLHQLMQACVCASLELTAPEKGLTYISRQTIFSRLKPPLKTEESANLSIPVTGLGNDKAIVPDDLFGLKGTDGQGDWYRFFALEIDRNTESIVRKDPGQTAFGKKISGYLDVLRRQSYRKQWGIPNLSVLTVTTNPTHAMNIIEFIRKQNEPRYAERFGFIAEPSFGTNWRVPRALLKNLLFDRWKTAGASKEICRP